MVSQVLTLYTTPVIYLYMERLRVWLVGLGATRRARRAPLPSETVEPRPAEQARRAGPPGPAQPFHKLRP
jgi:hypothetical protein